MKKRIKKTMFYFLNEDLNAVVDNGPQKEVPLEDVSLDAKVDRFLVQYERESVPNSREFNITSPVQERTLKGLMKSLFEAPGDEPPTDEEPLPDAGGGDAIPDTDPMGMDSDAAPDGGGEAKELDPVPEINITDFTMNVARLVQNYEDLMNPKRIIMNRAKAYLEKNYNSQKAKEFIDLLDTQYSLSPTDEDKYGEVEGPYAGRSLEPLDAPTGGGGG